MDLITALYSDSRGMEVDEVRRFFDEIGMTGVILSAYEYYGHLNPDEMMDHIRDAILIRCAIYHPFVPWATRRVQVRAPVKSGRIVNIYVLYALGGRMIEDNTWYEDAEV